MVRVDPLPAGFGTFEIAGPFSAYLVPMEETEIEHETPLLAISNQEIAHIPATSAPLALAMTRASNGAG